MIERSYTVAIFFLVVVELLDAKVLTLNIGWLTSNQYHLFLSLSQMCYAIVSSTQLSLKQVEQLFIFVLIGGDCFHEPSNQRLLNVVWFLNRFRHSYVY